MSIKEAIKILKEYLALDKDIDNEYLEAQKVVIKAMEQVPIFNKNNYRYKIDTLIDNVMTPTFNPKEYIWVLGSKVLASLVLERNKYLKAEVEYNTLYGIEVHEGRDYGDEAIMLLRDITKVRHINNIHHVTNLTIN